MAASVGMILDAAVKYERSAETQPQYPEETAEGAHAPVSSSSPVEGSHVRDKEPMDDQSTDTSGASVPSQLEQNVVSAAEKATEDSPSSPHALVISAPEADIASVSRPKKSTPSGAKSKKAKNVLGIVGPKKKKLKKKLEHKHPSIGLCVDALDRNMVWGNGRIIDINVAEEKVKITFQGYNSNWDIWTDLLSIRPHGNMAWPQRGLNAKSWDGRSNLFTGEPLVDSVYNDRSVSAPPPSQPASFEKRIAQAPATKTAGPKSVKREAAQKLKPNDIRVAEPKKASEARKRKRVVRDESPKGSSRGPSTPWSDPEAVRARNSNNALTDGSSAFLVRCAEVWKKQLQSMTDIVVSR